MCFSLALALISLAEELPNSAPPVQAPRRTVLAIVRDVRTGDPIRDAPVKWLGATANARTDENGQAVLVDDTGEREMRIWTELDHYTVDVRTMRWMQGWNAVELWVQPTFASVSPILPAASGGTHEFHSGGATVRVIIKPGTFSRDVTIGFASFPKWSMEVEEGCELPLLLGQLSVLDERGKVLDIPAAQPIGVNLSVRSQEEAEEAGFMTIHSQRDPTTNRRKRCGSGWSNDVPFGLESGGLGRIPFFVSQHARDNAAMHMPAITVDVERTECEMIARRSIACGRFGAETTLTTHDPGVVAIDPGLGVELARAIPGAPQIALGLVEARVGVEMSMKFDGSLSATTIAKFTNRLNESAQAVGTCFNGTADSMLVRAVYAVKVDGKKIGTITKPIASYVRRTLVHDPSCGKECATPVDPTVDAWIPCQ